MNLRISALIVIIFINTTSGSLLVRSHSNIIEKQLTHYFRKLDNCNFTKNSRCYVLFDETDHLQSLKNYFIKLNSDCSFLITTGRKKIGQDIHFNAQNLFVFISSIHKIMKTGEMIMKNQFWSTTTKTYFIVTSEVNKTNVPDILLEIWSRKITNFVLIFVVTKYNVYTYNAFDETEIIEISEKNFCREHFLVKEKNLHQKPFRSALSNRVPYTVKENGKWSGIELQLLELFTNALNASVTIIEKSDPNSSIVALQNDEADIFFMRVFQVFYFVDVDYSYPYGMGQKVVMVPKATKIPPYKNIFYIFDRNIWIWLICSMFILTILLMLSDLQSPRLNLFLNYNFYIWAILLNVGIRYELLKTKLKWLFSVWIWCCLILSAAFQSSLLKSYLKPIYGKSITNIDDLRESSLKFHLHPYFAANKDLANMLNFRDKYVVEELTETGNFLEQRDTSAAVLVSKEYAKYYMNKLKKINGDPTYKILEKNLIPGVLVIHLQKNSPFLEIFDEFVLLSKQHGLIREETYYEAKSFNNNEVLNTSHFLAVYFLLGIGILCGMVTLIGEILWYKYKH